MRSLLLTNMFIGVIWCIVMFLCGWGISSATGMSFSDACIIILFIDYFSNKARKFWKSMDSTDEHNF